MTNEDRVRAYWDCVWSRGEVEYATEFYAPTFLLNGREASAARWAEGAREWRECFDDFSVAVDRLFPIERGAVSRVTYRGRQAREVAGIVPAARSYEITGLDVFLFADGRCVEHLHEADHELLFAQLRSAD